jgi:hypothetical protein
MPARHFPPPWTIEELDTCFVVIDSGLVANSLSVMPVTSQHRSQGKTMA